MSLDVEGDYLMVLCTCPDTEVAAEIARVVVDAGVAACANRIDAVSSLFRWEGALTEEDETLLILKTRREAFDRLVQLIGDTHPYEVPEIIALPILFGNAPYLSWIDESLS